MAILTKAALRAAIDSVFASGQNITAEAARGAFHDWIDSLLDAPSVVAGSGISVSRDAGVVTVATGGAAAAVGIPSYVAAGAAQPSDAVLTANIVGLTNSPPFPSLVYLLTPNVLNRAADDLELRVNGDVSRVRSLVDFRGEPLKARDLDPGALYEILATFGPDQQYRLTEPIPGRRQDWTLAVGWVHLAQTPPLQAEIDGMLELDGQSWELQDMAQGLNPADPNTRDYIWMGVPEDAPDLLGAAPVRPAVVGDRGHRYHRARQSDVRWAAV